MEKPSDEEMEEMAKIDDLIKTGQTKGGAEKTMEATEFFLKKARALDFTNIDPKKATAKILEILTSEDSPDKVDLPKDADKQMKVIGPIVVRHLSDSPEEIVSQVVKELGFVEAKAAREDMIKKSIESSCKVPANAPIAKVILELADVYFRSNNQNAGGKMNFV
jgi:hypothetical protein